MTTAARLVTAEELSVLDNKHLELLHGELRTVSPAGFQHGSIAVQIALLLQQHVRTHCLGAVLVEVGCILTRNPDTVLGPDVAFIRQSRLPIDEHVEKFFDGAPDLAVEIISPSNPRRTREQKMQTYMRYGTALGWLVDPRAQTVHVYRPDGKIVGLAKFDIITGEEVIPGFDSQVIDFFA